MPFHYLPFLNNFIMMRSWLGCEFLYMLNNCFYKKQKNIGAGNTRSLHLGGSLS
jgi:hypothetical protein